MECQYKATKTLASCNSKYSIVLWNVETGQQKCIFNGHRSEINQVCFSPDGKMLASGSRYESIRLWDVETKKQIAQLFGHYDPITSVCFSPDGTQLASSIFVALLFYGMLRQVKRKPNQQITVVVFYRFASLLMAKYWHQATSISNISFKNSRAHIQKQLKKFIQELITNNYFLIQDYSQKKLRILQKSLVNKGMIIPFRNESYQISWPDTQICKYKFFIFLIICHSFKMSKGTQMKHHQLTTQTYDIMCIWIQLSSLIQFVIKFSNSILNYLIDSGIMLHNNNSFTNREKNLLIQKKIVNIKVQEVIINQMKMMKFF